MANEPSGTSRRRFLATFGASVGSISLAGCLGRGRPRASGNADRTLYVGAYHWGFVLLDEAGTEHKQLTLDPGTRIRLIGVNTSAESAIAELPGDVKAALPDHESLEMRNEERIPTPPTRDLHEALEEANARYPDHSMAVMPSGYNHMQGPMDSGMMLHPVTLPHDAPRPAAVGLIASERGDYTVTCLTNCGYGHPYMELDGAFVVP